MKERFFGNPRLIVIVIRRVIKISPLYENLTVQFITEKEFLNAKISFSIYWEIVADFGFYFRAYNKDIFYLIRVEADKKRIVLYKSLTGGKLVVISIFFNLRGLYNNI